MRSGTSIGAMIHEREHAESKLDFIHKFAVAQKECNETLYWLEILFNTDYICHIEYESLNYDATELMKMITVSIKTVKKYLKTSN